MNLNAPSPAAANDRYVTIATDRRIHCHLQGAGRCVVFLPGNGCSQDDIGPLRDAIVPHYRCLGVDPPGREPTLWPDEPFDFVGDMTPLVGRVLEDLDAGPRVVIGHSMGGMLALQHARAAGSVVRGLVLMEGFVSLKVHYRVVSHDGFRSVRMAPAIEEAFRRRRALNEAWEARHPVFTRTFWESQKRHDARGWVADLGVPILVVIGDLGQPMPPRGDMAAWRRHLGMEGVADLEVCTIPNAGHWMMLDDPAAVTAAVMRFMDRVHQ